ncbi:putative gtpase gap [Erysiphe necator]|uniref:Putative gtpase gap n=1 Tax=Uncinula necator TaxID=52586 RepID=A0A0B1P1A9_UNCNE|nr:putative gtpase gap [Erysiphe necator]
MLSEKFLYDLSVTQRLMQSNNIEDQPNGNIFIEKHTSDENGTESNHTIPQTSSLFSTKELSDRKLRACEKWTDSSAQMSNELTEVACRNDCLNYLEEYNTLAEKFGVRLIHPSTFMLSTENLRSVSLRHESWFSRKFSRLQTSPQNMRDKQLRHKRSLSDISSRLSGRKDKFKGKNLQELGRLCGFSLLYLPTEYSPGGLLLPTCFRALAHYLLEYGLTTRGLFLIPGSHNTVNELYNYFCNSCEQSKAVAGTVRSPTLPGHIKCDVYDIASAFKRFLVGLPGGILGSPTLFNVLISINIQLSSGPESMKTKLCYVRSRLIALAVLNLSSESRRNLICAVYGLLCLIGQAAEAMKKKKDLSISLPAPDYMNYSSLSTIFGPIIIGDLIESYTMRIANPRGGLILLPISPPKSRKERKSRSGKTCDESKEDYVQMDKIEIANKVTQMIITEWSNVVQHIKNLISHNQKWRIKRSATSGTTQLPPFISESSPKNTPQVDKIISKKASFSENLPSVNKGPLTPDKSENNHITKQSSIVKSLRMLAPHFTESSSRSIPKFRETSSQGSQARFGHKKILPSASFNNFLQSSSRIAARNKCCSSNSENSLSLNSSEKKFNSKNLDLSFVPDAPFEEMWKTILPNKNSNEEARPSMKNAKGFKVSKTRSYLPIPTERRLKRSSKFEAKKLPRRQKTSQSQGNLFDYEPLRIFQDETGQYSQFLNQKSIERIQPCSCRVSESNADQKLPNNVYDASNLLHYDMRCNLNDFKTSKSKNSPLVTKSSENNNPFSEKLPESVNPRYYHIFNFTPEAKYDSNMKPRIFLRQNEDKVMKHELDYVNQTDESIAKLDSISRSTGRRSNKMSDLLAKFENDLYTSPKIIEVIDSKVRSIQSRNRLLGEYTKNLPTIKPMMSIEPDMVTQNAISSFKSSNLESEVVQSKGIVPRSSLLNLRDAPSLPLRRVKSSIEKSLPKTNYKSVGISRPLSMISRIDREYSESGKMKLDVQKLFNNNSILSRSKQKFAIQEFSAEELKSNSIAGSREYVDSKYLNPSINLAPGRSNPVLFDQVRNLQRLLDKKCEEIHKLKQQAGAWHDITIGTLKQKLEDSKRNAQYWQEKAKIFELRFYSLHQAISSRDSQEYMYLLHEAGLSRPISNLDELVSSELSYRSFRSSQTNKWETASNNSECSNGTVVRGSRNIMTDNGT